LFGGNEMLLLQELFDGQQTSLVDENGPLVLLDRVDQRAQRFGRTLDDLLESGNALEEVLVKREISLVLIVFGFVFLEGSDAGEHQELVLTAVAVLALVVVEGT